ncbi:UNVERIFIED_CONTAM: hypothetical protein FKN15_063709 [Acipenser sinensis]
MRRKFLMATRHPTSGIAKANATLPLKSPAKAGDFTQPGHDLHSPDYMTPELCIACSSTMRRKFLMATRHPTSGIAKANATLPLKSPAKAGDFTQPGHDLHSPDYMTPELCIACSSTMRRKFLMATRHPTSGIAKANATLPLKSPAKAGDFTQSGHDLRSPDYMTPDPAGLYVIIYPP